MTKLLLVLGMTSAVTIAGVLMWKVEAAPLAGGHQFACGNRELVSSAHGGMYVRHAPVPCRHQVVLHQSCGSDRPHKACICRPC